MSPTEKILYLFKDTFYNNLVLSFDSELVFWAIWEFEGLNFNVLSVSIIAVILALLSNYLFGVVLNNIFISNAGEMRLAKFTKLEHLWQKWYLSVFFLCFVPNMIKLILVLCGFLKFKVLRSILLGLTFKILFISFIWSFNLPL